MLFLNNSDRGVYNIIYLTWLLFSSSWSRNVRKPGGFHPLLLVAPGTFGKVNHSLPVKRRFQNAVLQFLEKSRMALIITLVAIKFDN